VAAGVWLLIGQGASYSRLARAIRTADPWWLALSLAASGLAYIGYAILYRAVSRVEGGPRPTIALALRMTIAVFGAAVIATAAGRIGSEYWSLRRMRESPMFAWARVLALNIALWAVLGLLAEVGALVCLISGDPRVPLAIELPWLLALPACTIPSLYLSSPRRRHLTEPTGGRIRRTVACVVQALVLLRTLCSLRAAGERGLLGGLIYWAGELLVVWAALKAFGIQLGYGPLLVAFTTGYAATILPLPVGGVGGVDAATIFALTLVGVPLGVALLATLVQRVLTYWLPVGVAVLSARLLRRLSADLAAVRPRAAAG